MKKYILIFLSFGLGFILFAAALKEVGLKNISLTISELSLWNFFILLGLFLLGLIVSTLRLKVIIETQYPQLFSFSTVFISKTAGAAISYLTPCVLAGGAPFKAYILSKEGKIPIRKTIASIIIENVIFLSIALVFFVIGIIILLNHFTLPANIIFFLVSVGIISSIVLLFFYYQTMNKGSGGKGFFIFLIEAFCLDKIKAINKIKTNIADVEKDISCFFKYQKTGLFKAVFLAVVEILLFLFTCWLTVIFLGNKLGIGQIISINALMNAVYLVPIPASLGTFEISQAFIFSLFGLSLSSGIAFSLTIRIMNLILAGIGVIFLVFFETKITTEKMSAKT